VSDPSDRRARKKAQTRAEIRGAAQHLFAAHGFDAVTIADVAEAADVAVQTVFNHFATKEELFFDGRTPWVDGPAEVVRSRRPGQAPLSALREWTVNWIGETAERGTSEDGHVFLSTIAASSTLRAFELSLQKRTEQRLSAALTEAWQDVSGSGPQGCNGTVEVRLAADLAAALWIAGARTLLMELRPAQQFGVDQPATPAAVVSLAGPLFDRLERSLCAVLSLPECRLPESPLSLPGPAQSAAPTRRTG
jgi:AcrR family transcriptional regulator